MHSEKEDKGSSQENTGFGDTDPTDCQIMIAWLVMSGNVSLLKSKNESGGEKNTLLIISIFSIKSQYSK